MLRSGQLVGEWALKSWEQLSESALLDDQGCRGCVCVYVCVSYRGVYVCAIEVCVCVCVCVCVFVQSLIVSGSLGPRGL